MNEIKVVGGMRRKCFITLKSLETRTNETSQKGLLEHVHLQLEQVEWFIQWHVRVMTTATGMQVAPMTELQTVTVVTCIYVNILRIGW